MIISFYYPSHQTIWLICCFVLSKQYGLSPWDYSKGRIQGDLSKCARQWGMEAGAASQTAWEEKRVFGSDSHRQTNWISLHNLAGRGSYRHETNLQMFSLLTIVPAPWCTGQLHLSPSGESKPPHYLGHLIQKERIFLIIVHELLI